MRKLRVTLRDAFDKTPGTFNLSILTGRTPKQ
jgi:hypothetical protein